MKAFEIGFSYVPAVALSIAAWSISEDLSGSNWFYAAPFFILFHFAVIVGCFFVFFDGRTTIQGATAALLVNFSALIWTSTVVNLNIGILHNGTRLTDMTDALYFSIVTFTTLGYGDIIPEKQLRLIAALQAVVGYVSLGLLLSAAIQIMQTKSKLSNSNRDDQ